MRQTYSAGGIVIGLHGKVLVVSQNGDSWSLPKGHIDPGETPRQTATREIAEESGISKLKFIKELGSYQRHKIGKDGKGEDLDELKNITMFLFATYQIALKPADPVHPEARWVRQEEVAELLTHPKDKEFFLRVLPVLQDLQNMTSPI